MLAKSLVRDSDIIFGMAVEHVHFLQSRFPQIRENVFLLKTFARDPDKTVDENIEDPIGGSPAVYQECAAVIDTELDRILPRLIDLIKTKLATASP